MIIEDQKKTHSSWGNYGLQDRMRLIKTYSREDAVYQLFDMLDSKLDALVFDEILARDQTNRIRLVAEKVADAPTQSIHSAILESSILINSLVNNETRRADLVACLVALSVVRCGCASATEDALDIVTYIGAALIAYWCVGLHSRPVAGAALSPGLIVFVLVIAFLLCRFGRKRGIWGWVVGVAYTACVVAVGCFN